MNVQANQNNQAINQEIAKAAEPKTIINGQEVTAKEAQAAEEEFNKQNTQTGIQQHHDNHTEAVQAGQLGQNVMQNMQQAMQQQQRAAVRQSELQSGQQHLSQHIQQAQQASKQVEQQMHQEEQQRHQQAQQQQQQMQQKTEGLSEQQKVEVEAHETIQKSLDAKAKQKKG